MSVEILEEKARRDHPLALNQESLPALSWGRPWRHLPLLIFKFFTSLRLAILVLFALIFALAAGTFLESLHGTEAARLLIYDSPWFGGVLMVLGINVACAALDRYPWQKKHTGFVVTHCGILLILIGSFVTQRWVVDGQMAIAEGQSEHRITLPEPILYVFAEEGHRPSIAALKKKPFAWHGKQKVLGSSLREPVPFEVYLLAYYPKARQKTAVIRSLAGPPALKVTLHNSFVNQTEWLVENDPSFGTLAMGPATLKFTDIALQENKGPAPEAGYLEFQFDPSALPKGHPEAERAARHKPSAGAPLKTTIHIPLTADLKLPATFPLEDTPYQITLTRLLQDAVVVGRELMDQAKDHGRGRESNPAVELLLEGNGLKERHTVFAKFPEFPTQHGMKPSGAGVRIFYRLPNAGSHGETHELRFVPLTLPSPLGGEGKGEELQYQIQDGVEIKTGIVKIGGEVPLGWMDLAFRVEEFFPHAEIRRSYEPEPPTSEGQEARPAIQVEVTEGTDTKTLWLAQGIAETLHGGGRTSHLLFAEKRLDAGFRLELRDFRIEYYPGTNRPASFESDVTLKDTSRGIVRDVTVSMNRPLVWRDYRIYQSGYSLPAGEPEISIFSVGRDPGIPVKYGGALVMIAGILTMFYTRRFSSHAGRLT